MQLGHRFRWFSGRETAGALSGRTTCRSPSHGGDGKEVDLYADRSQARDSLSLRVMVAV